MSDDLVSRLRRAVTWQGVVPHGNQLARQAADEIERLWPARSPCCNAPLVFYDNELAQFVFWDGRRVPPGGERLRCYRCDNEVREGASENFRLFVEAVAEMRRLQREYFRTRGSGVLAAAKDAEREVDRMLKKMQPDQRTLF